MLKTGDVVWSNASAQYYCVASEVDFGLGGVSYELAHIENGRGNRQSIEVFAPARGLERVIVNFVGFVHLGQGR